MDEQDPPGTHDFPQLAARVSDAGVDERGQEESGTCGEELGHTTILVPPPPGSLLPEDGSLAGLHLESRSEWGSPGVMEDFRPERGGDAELHTDVNEMSLPLDSDRNRSRNFQEQGTAENSAGFVGVDDDSRAAADFPRTAFHDNANCEERRQGMSSDFERGVSRDRDEATVACLDLNVEEKPEEGTDSDHVHSVSAGERNVRDISDDLVGDVNLQGSQCGQTDAFEQLTLINNERERMCGIDLMRQSIATGHSKQGTETIVQREWQAGSPEDGCVEKRFLSCPFSENVRICDLNDEMGPSSSQTYEPSLLGRGNNLQNKVCTQYTPFENQAVRIEHLTDRSIGEPAGSNTSFADAAEELVGAELRKANPVDAQGEGVVQSPDRSSIQGEKRMSKEEMEKHRFQGTSVSDVSMTFNVENLPDAQLIPLHVMEVDTAKQASEEAEDKISLGRPGEMLFERISDLDKQSGHRTCEPGVLASSWPPVDNVEVKTHSETLHVDMTGNTEQPALQLSEQQIGQELPMKTQSETLHVDTTWSAEQPASQLSEQQIYQELTMGFKFVQDVSRNSEQLASMPPEKLVNQEIATEQELTMEHDGDLYTEQEVTEERDGILHAEEEPTEEHDGDFHAEQELIEECDGGALHEEEADSLVDLMDQENDDTMFSKSSEGDIGKEATKEQSAAKGLDGNFCREEDEANMGLIGMGNTLMQLAEEQSNEIVRNEESVLEEGVGNSHMNKDVGAGQQLGDQDSIQHLDKYTNDVILGDQNTAERYGGGFHVEEDDCVGGPVDEPIDGQGSIQTSEKHTTEETMKDQSAEEEIDSAFHIGPNFEVVDNEVNDHSSSQPSDEQIDDEMIEDNTVEGQYGVPYMEEESAVKIANRQVDDETLWKPSVDIVDTAGWSQNDEDEDREDLHSKDVKSASISDMQVGDQVLNGERIVDKFDGGSFEAEQNALGVWKDEGSEESNKGGGTSEAGSGERFSEEMEMEEHSAGQSSEVSKEGFNVGDLVWAKVKSHPWWPGQIFDPADASEFAKKVQKPGRILVAFFGDCTFGWLQESQMVAFRPNFEEKVKQTNMKSFCKAIAEALDEVSRRSELGTSCSCHGGVLHSAATFPDANTGIQEGVRVKRHPDIWTSKLGFNSEKILKFIKGVACSPFGSWSSSLEAAEIRGHVYGSRTGMHKMEKSDSDDLLQNILTGLRDKAGRGLATPLQGLKLKRRFSSLETGNSIVAERGKEAKKINTGKGAMLKEPLLEGGLQLSASRNSTEVFERDDAVALREDVIESGKVKGLVESSKETILGKGKRTSFTKTFESSKKLRRSGLDGNVPESMVGTEAAKEISSDDDAETLFALSGFHSKLLRKVGKGSTREGTGKRSTNTKPASNVLVDREGLEKSSSDVKSVSNIVEERDGSEQSTAEVKSVSSTVIAREGLDQMQEVSPSKRILMEADGAFEKECLAAQNKATSNASLPVLAAPHLERTNELLAKFHNDVDPSLPKEAELPHFKSVQAEPTVKVLDNKIAVKDQKAMDETSVPVPNSKTMLDAAVKSEKQSSILRSKQETDLKKPSKAIKLGECIQRVAGELTGSPPITKSVDQNSTKRAVFDISIKSGPKKEMKGSITDNFGLSKSPRLPANLSVEERSRRNSVQLLQGLHFLARNPLNNANPGKPLGGVTAAVLKFRDMMFQKSSGYGAAVSILGGQSVGKTGVHLDNNDHVSDPKPILFKSQPSVQDFPPSIQKHGVQELALAARKRKSEVVQEGLAKMSKKGMVTATTKGQHALKSGASAVKVMEQTHKSKHQKHYPSETISPNSDLKSPRQSDDKLPSHSPVGLYMKFPQSVALPSEAQLKATFIRFGALQTAGTRVYRSNASAQVVFKQGRDAEMALKYAKENAIFGQAAVTFRLRYFSQPEKVDSKQNVSSFEKEKSVRGDGRLLSPRMERLDSIPHATKPSSLDRGEHGRTGSVADIPVSRQLQATDNASNNNISLNLSSLIPNAASTVNESSGDIQDQMIKLLRQVSVIVSSSSLTSEAS